MIWLCSTKSIPPFRIRTATKVTRNVLLNLTEAKRWDVSYGFGFEVQTGTPTEGCLSIQQQMALGIQSSYQCNPNGHTGASPRILFNVSRTNLRGTDQSITLRTNYGTLEQIALLSYQDPHFRGQALAQPDPLRRLQQQRRDHHLPGVDSFRSPSPVSARDQAHHLDLFLLLPAGGGQGGHPSSQPGGDSLARPTGAGRAVRESLGSAILATLRSTPITAASPPAKNFFADSKFGSQANFDRIDLSNATYYDFGRDHWVIARQTRYGQERVLRRTGMSSF